MDMNGNELDTIERGIIAALEALTPANVGEEQDAKDLLVAALNTCSDLRERAASLGVDL